jgi:hypothetical protein
MGLLVVPAAAAPTQVQVTVSPRSALLDAPFHIRVTGLRERELVSLRVTVPAYPGGTLSASRMARANGQGAVDLPHPDLLGTLSPAKRTPKNASPRLTSTIRVAVSSHGRLLSSAPGDARSAVLAQRGWAPRAQKRQWSGCFLASNRSLPIRRMHKALLTGRVNRGSVRGAQEPQPLLAIWYSRARQKIWRLPRARANKSNVSRMLQGRQPNPRDRPKGTEGASLVLRMTSARLWTTNSEEKRDTPQCSRSRS